MEFITDEDLEKITNCGGQEVNDIDYKILKNVYEKLEFICLKLKEYGFEYSIRKDPRKQAGQGLFQFQHYQWARIYPPGVREFCNDKFSYIISISDTLQFHMMGIKEYQEKPPSKRASDLCSTEIDINTSDFDSLAKDFAEFDKKYRELFIQTAIELGINGFLNLKNKFQMKKMLDLLEFKKQIILQGPPGTGKTFTAKDIAEQMIFGEVNTDKEKQKANLESKSEQYKLIQFHPAYSYEDFVRGIVVKTNGKHITYETENKVLGEFAYNAYQNWKASNDPQNVFKETWLQSALEDFKENITVRLKDEEKIMLTRKVYINRITEYGIRYNSDVWDVDGGVPDSDIQKMYLADVSTRKEIKELNSLTKTAKSLSTYWLKILELFKKYIHENKLSPLDSTTVNDEKKYILIIDEINRANLPAVLGELIYALEYRGQTVKSMYDLEGDRTLLLPPNLYIIGTMNTADRSVGHIDYAIRRRFAFVDIAPSIDIIDDVINDPALCISAKELFGKVADLFHEKKDDSDQKTVYLQSDFKAKDVQMGHSYFLAKDENQLKLKLDFEIKPLLNEYVKDGILNEEALKVINIL